MIKKFIISLFLLLIVVAPAMAGSLIQTSAKQAVVVDYETGMVLLEKNADERMPTSSMSKVMSIYVIFDALKNNKLFLNTKLLVSEKAWRKGGSKMFVEVGKYVKAEDLIRGVIVQSGNDATIVLAEALAGSEAAFAQSITEKAHELGMNNSNFVNASGWPDKDHYSTARDLTILAKAMITDFPQYYSYYSEKEFTYNNIKQRNRNPILYRNIGADGIKTGHTEAGGYGLIGSGVSDGRRVILVINGLRDEKARAQESAKLLEWGLKRFENHKLFSAGDIVANAAVAMGRDKALPLVIKEDINVTIPKISLKEFKVTANFKEPVIAPVKQGDLIGTLVIDIPYMQKIERSLYAGSSVDSLGFFAKSIARARMFFSKGQI